MLGHSQADPRLRHDRVSFRPVTDRPPVKVGQRPVRPPRGRRPGKRLTLGAGVGRDLDRPVLANLEQPASPRIGVRVPPGRLVADPCPVRREDEAALVPAGRLGRSQVGERRGPELAALVGVVEVACEGVRVAQRDEVRGPVLGRGGGGRLLGLPRRLVPSAQGVPARGEARSPRRRRRRAGFHLAASTEDTPRAGRAFRLSRRSARPGGGGSAAAGRLSPRRRARRRRGR